MGERKEIQMTISRKKIAPFVEFRITLVVFVTKAYFFFLNLAIGSNLSGSRMNLLDRSFPISVGCFSTSSFSTCSFSTPLFSTCSFSTSSFSTSSQTKWMKKT